MKVASDTIEIIAPVSGPVVSLDRVPDPVFAQKIVGDGLAIEPTSDTLLAPCDGTVVHLHPSGHAVTLETTEGVQILHHIGIDTVQLRGQGFSPQVKVGERVKKGDALITFDLDGIAQKAKSLITVVVVTESKGRALQPTEQARVVAGKDLLFKLRSGWPAVRSSAQAPTSSSGTFSSQVTLNTGHGLHARPSAQLVQIAKAFRSEIGIEKAGKKANARSLVTLLNLEAENGESLTITATGPDAEAAVFEVREFLRSPFEDKADAPAAKPRETDATTSTDKSVIKGAGASPGLVLGQVQQLRTMVDLPIPEKATGSPQEEKAKLETALAQAAQDLQSLAKDLDSRGHANEAKIFLAHQELLTDPGLCDLAEAHLQNGQSAAFSWKKATETVSQQLAQLNNELMAHRSNDVRDVGRRVIRLLQPQNGSGASVFTLKPPFIVIADNLTPTEITEFDLQKVIGFCTPSGSKTSHVAILARSLGIPALVGAERRCLDIPDGTEILLDVEKGELRLNLSASEKVIIADRQNSLKERSQNALQRAHETVKTSDGKEIHVLANISSAADARKAVEMGCDGVGLLRSEFLFHGRTTAPSEDEQLKVYQEIADVLDGRPLTIRTLDVGGDKPLSYLPIAKEENPFLGLRGIRVSFKYPDVFRTQLRAILRVKSKSPIHVMFPMISTLEEFRKARAIFEEERAKLQAQPLPLGIMIEVPSAALSAEVFAKEAEFFSIGTNDLTQYTMAADRGNSDLEVDTLHPAIFKLIGMTVEAAHRHKRWVAVCGDLAGEPQAVPKLIALGVDELSMVALQIPNMKEQIRETPSQGQSHDNHKDVVFVPAENR